MSILVVSATSGNNLKLAQALSGVVNELGGMAEVLNLENVSLPLYTPSAEGNGIPSEAVELAQKFINAKGIILVAPEYNGSIPAIMINAISWVSRSGDDWRGAFNGKFSVVATHSGGGGQKVLEAMRKQLEHLGSVVLPRSVHTTYSKELNPDSAQAIMKQLLQYC